MLRTIARLALGLAACALLLQPSIMNAKDQVVRPLKGGSDLTIVVYDPYPMEAVLEGTGWMTHIGHYISEGTLGPGPIPGLLAFSGTAVGPNGDEIYWMAIVNPGVEMATVITGGTGRFKNASGEWWSEYTYRDVDTSNYPVVVVRYGSEVVSGWIKY